MKQKKREPKQKGSLHPKTVFDEFIPCRCVQSCKKPKEEVILWQEQLEARL